MKNEVWLVDDDKSIRWVLKKALEKVNITVVTFDHANTILAKLDQVQPSTIITDIKMPGISGLELLEQVNQLYPQISVIIMTAYSDLDSAVAAYRGGAFEYLPKPFDVDEAVDLIKRSMPSNAQQINPQIKTIKPSEIIGSAPAMQEVFRAIGRLSKANITVLITGASGTGKELVAQALHKHSPRADKAFIALNTAAIPRDLLESELFGHERGAFTGASTHRIGRFEQANAGTLFLDEIGDMPAELQTRLLRVLSDGSFFRVGGHSPIKVDVRIIAATHQDLELKVKLGEFREDLYHRLNVIKITIPSLCQRQEDIPILARHFLAKAAKTLNIEAKSMAAETEQYLCQLEWRGNVRQLENVCHWLTVMASTNTILIEDLPPELHKQLIQENNWQQELQLWVEQQLAQGGAENLLAKLGCQFEQVMIKTVLKHTAGKRQEAARLLGWGRNTLSRKIKELGLENMDNGL